MMNIMMCGQFSDNKENMQMLIDDIKDGYFY
jgi:hypothetical protein